MSEGFAGDPMHEGSEKPMIGLKGSMIGPNTQAPMHGENAGKSQGGANDTSGNIAGWNTTSLKGDHPTTGSNDKNKAH